MTVAGGRHRLAIAASLALHAGVLVLLWQSSPPAVRPLLPMTALQLTLQAPPAAAPAMTAATTSTLTAPSPLPQGRGLSFSAAITDRSEDGTAEPAASQPSPAAAYSAVTTDAPATPAQESDMASDRSAATEADTTAAMADSSATSALTGPTPATPSYTSGQVMASVEQAFSAHFYYPTLARRKGWEGEVTLAVRVENDGRLTGIHVVSSSGYLVLDHAAMDSLLRARAVPLPGGTLVDGLDMVLPVQYRLFDARV
jgi:protein TonB